MVYLVDFIGVHCGMHYYLDAFKRILESLDGVEVGIVSNYSVDGNPPVLLNHYAGNKLRKIISAGRNLIRLQKFISRHRDDHFIYLTYGNILDPYFLKVISKAPHHCIDIHEALAQNEDSNIRLREKLAKVYSSNISDVITHSSRTDDYLMQFGYEGNKYEVPHFKYVFPRDYDMQSISDDIRRSVDKDKVNVLFFGNITREKGIDILLDAVNNISDKDAARLNVIVAGKDIDGVYRRVKLKSDRKVSFFTRHISDDELRFLYDNVDYLALPYRKTSQSGILEMAFYFKKPIIASDIPYFRKMLTLFPSFGYLDGNCSKDFSQALHEMIYRDPSDFFNDDEYARYENRKEVEDFKAQFRKWITSKNDQK
ncbi:MAG: glycosyltransferase [Muribaculaceae bacterium]|nr:glycosyltransferase [Muribaculaceae bacterium]MDE6552858.1 glycosyltransferase [Muribaculaceae bacterium]